MDVTFTTAPLARSSSSIRPARQHDRGEEIDLEHVLPVLERGLDGAEPRAALALGRDGGVADQRVEAPVLGLEPLPHLADGAQRVGRVGEIDLDVILRPHLPGAVLGEGVARAGDHAPARRGEALDGSVADAARGTGEDQRLFLSVGDIGHGCSSRLGRSGVSFLTHGLARRRGEPKRPG